MLAIAGYPSINGYHTHANTAANVSFSKEQRKGNATVDDQQLEAACREWVQEVAGVTFAEGSSLQEELRSGVVLCKLGNAIRPGARRASTVRKVPSRRRPVWRPALAHG